MVLLLDVSRFAVGLLVNTKHLYASGAKLLTKHVPMPGTVTPNT